MQGMWAGVGPVVGRAIIRDCFEGAAATRLLALVSMIFSLSPALAPVFGGWVVTLFTWRAIFLTLFAYAVAMLMLCVHSLRKPCRGMPAAHSESVPWRSSMSWSSAIDASVLSLLS